MEGVTAIKETEKPSLLERIYSWENLLNAYHEAASEKWYRSDVLAFSARLEENLIEIQNSLIWRTYKVGRYREFYVSEPKRRLIMALSFPDRVVQWAVYLQVNKELDNGMIYHSYGRRVGKGTTRAADRLQYWATLVDRKPGPSWHYLKLDISKYFYRVDHKVLLGILRRKYPNEDGFLWLMETIISCDHTPFGLPPGKTADEVPPSERLFEVGMPIGNLTSQLLANVCLNELDQYIKHELKAHFYERYMDDMALLHPDAAVLNEWRVKIEDYLKANCVGHIRAAYGCSLGGSFVGLLAARGNIRMDYGILGSSDLDQSSKFAAKLQTNLLLSLMFPMLRDGRFKSPLLQKRVEKQMRQMGDYGAAFLRILGGARPYLTQQSCKNQFYSDLITPLPDKLDVPGTEIHIFYALKMGEKYRARYEQHFAHPIIHEQDMQHEELLACHPQEWAALVKSIVGKEKSV